MPQDLSELFAELGEAKAQLQRSNRKARALVRDRRAALDAQKEKPLFDWTDMPDQP